MTKELNTLGISDGNYVVSMELLRDEVGSSEATADKLMLDEISTSRDEIALIPKYLAGTVSSLATSYENFANGKFFVKEIVGDLLPRISQPQLYGIYYQASAADPSGSKSFKFNYGFTDRSYQSSTNSAQAISNSSDSDVVAFLTDVFYGVKKGNRRSGGQLAVYDILGIYDQFRNWLYANYEAGTTFQEIRDYYYSLFRYIIDVELNHITNKKPDDYEQIVAFLQSIFYDLLFFPELSTVETNYQNGVGGYFKHSVNLEDGRSFFILNRKFEPSDDPAFNGRLVLKLSEPLPLGVVEGDSVWITNNFGFQPVVQNVYYFSLPVVETVKLRGPNFLIRTESQGNPTEILSMEQLVEETGSAYNELVSKLGAKSSASIDNTDYRYFANFVNFSSATLRMGAYDWKVNEIDALQAEVVRLSAALAQNPSDQFYQKELTDTESSIDEIEAGMDGYEKFLYNNPQWYETHASSASLYDKENLNALINNLPQFIVADADANADYITFVGMVGHFFDNLLIAAKQITDKNKYSMSSDAGISSDVVYDMLRSLGWEAEISKDNLPLLLSSFSKQDFDEDSELYSLAKTFSEEQRNKVIWKRILNTLPYLYKTKGTEAGLSALITCFGIPKNIVKIKEYGGIESAASMQDETLYVIDEVKYEPYFSGSGEYFQLNWTPDAQTFEFNFSFDPSKTSTQGEVFRLANCSGSWALGALREKGEDWGKLFFSLADGAGNVRTIMTDKAPIFDGKTYHAMVRKNNLSPTLGYVSSASMDDYPVKYDLYVQRGEDSRVTYFTSASVFLSGSYNSSFRSGSQLYVGNYEQNTSSIVNDPEAFFGNIDEIKVWEGVVDDDRFTNHTLYQNAYDMDTPQQMVAENLFRISFERPVDLYDTGSATVTLNNLAFRTDYPTFDAVNFPAFVAPIPKVQECDPGSGSVFPYQFTRKDTRQTVKIPQYGANKFRSNKINYISQGLVSALSPTARATAPASRLVSTDANKLGVFFSPVEAQNMEIIKFFGDYPLTDLLGDPQDVYASSYRKFEKFKQIFYAQGFGAIDYQFFMNIVRFYFDKAMMKYMRSMVPARAKLVDGILIEPSILERPKIELKPIAQETIPQRTALTDGKTQISVASPQRMLGQVSVRDSGTSILSDINQTFFPSDEDKYAFGVMADTNGVTYYNGEYYRADLIRVVKKFHVRNKYALAQQGLSDYEKLQNLNGTIQTITGSYYKINLAKLPVVTEYPLTMSVSLNTSYSVFYLSGSVSFTPVSQGLALAYLLTDAVPHSFTGKITGSVYGLDPRRNLEASASIRSIGLNVTATSNFAASSSVVYSGNFSLSGSLQMFDGIVLWSTGSTNFNALFRSSTGTGSIFDEFRNNTVPPAPLFPNFSSGLLYAKDISMQTYPSNARLFTGYSPDHYKFGREQFSQKIINSYDSNGRAFKWKKSSQTKKTTVDALSGLLDNSDPVETKKV